VLLTLKPKVRGVFLVYVRNSADPSQVHLAEKQSLEDSNQDIRDLLTVLSTVEGRRFYWNLMGDCGVFMVSYVKDSDKTVFNEGMRSIGNMLLVKVNEADPGAYSLMATEAKNREEILNPKERKRKQNA
jgi:hypothetical protein